MKSMTIEQTMTISFVLLHLSSSFVQLLSLESCQMTLTQLKSRSSIRSMYLIQSFKHFFLDTCLSKMLDGASCNSMGQVVTLLQQATSILLQQAPHHT